MNGNKKPAQDASELAMEYCEQSQRKTAIEKDLKWVISHLGKKRSNIEVILNFNINWIIIIQLRRGLIRVKER